jgi:DNA excision repair protein ERCC-2
MFNKYNNLLKDYYQYKYGNGYDYAYTFKGFNKVIQAVGRLIRSETDLGNAILIDERFTNYKYLPLVRMVWDKQIVVNSTDELINEITYFNSK